jgi:hypothetical protein
MSPEELLRRSFREDTESGVMCRWHSKGDELVLDVMPTRADLLGFANEWQAEAFPHAAEVALRSGRRIRAAPPAYLLATKIEAFKRRGERDFYGSRDFSDIVALVDGREELGNEIAQSPARLRRFLSSEIALLLDTREAVEGISGQLRSDPASQQRSTSVVIPRLQAIVNTAP